jgi:DNA replication protein DnaC
VQNRHSDWTWRTTHIALALGLAACQKGCCVRFTTAVAMVHELIEAKDDKRLLRYQKQMGSSSHLVNHVCYFF